LRRAAAAAARGPPPAPPASTTAATPLPPCCCPRTCTRGWSWSCSATARCARRWTSTATSCRPWHARLPTAWALCCCQVRVGKLQPQLQPETTQAALQKENGLVIGVELRGLEPLTPTLPVWCATSCATAPFRLGLVCPSREQLYRGGRLIPRKGWRRPWRAPPPGGRCSALLHLRDAQVVAERVSEAEVDAVGLVDRLLGDLHALRLELGVGLEGVVALEEEVAAGGPLGDELAHLRRGLLTHRRRPRLLQQDLPVGLPRQGDRQPPHGAELHVVGDLEAELADVEVERLVLVGHVDLGDSDGRQQPRTV